MSILNQAFAVLCLSSILVAFNPSTAGASGAEGISFAQPSILSGTAVTEALSPIMLAQARELINWKVGDTASYDVSMASMGKMGTLVKSVTKEEGPGVWVREETNLQSQNDVVEILLNRADGKVLKFIHNGQEQAAPDDKVEIISEDQTQITVPAGTFKCYHVVGKTTQISKVEIWLNPKEIVMDGSLKQAATTQFGDIVIELTSFKHGT